jgi:hypothetical protein
VSLDQPVPVEFTDRPQFLAKFPVAAQPALGHGLLPLRRADLPGTFSRVADRQHSDPVYLVAGAAGIAVLVTDPSREQGAAHDLGGSGQLAGQALPGLFEVSTVH